MTEQEYEKIYQVVKNVYENKIDLNNGLIQLVNEGVVFNESSYKLTIQFFKSLVLGEKYTYTANTEMTKYFINKIGEEYGIDGLKKARIDFIKDLLYNVVI